LEELEAPKFDWRAKMPLVFGVVVAGALGVTFWVQTRHAVPRPMLTLPPGQEQAVRGTTRPASTVASATAPAAVPAVERTPAPAPRTSPPPPARPAPPPRVPPPPPAATAPAATAPAPSGKSDFLTPGIELVTDPPVDVALDKKPYGRTPIVIPASPGKHALTLSDQAKGINQTRAVTVRKDGVTSLHLTVGRGTLSVRAPQGARVIVDGRVVGSSPVDDLHLFEGTHHLKVTLGDAVWQQSFVLRNEQSLRYDVELKPTNGG